MIARLRSQGKTVLPVASFGIAATLLPGGRTTHSRFGIPIVIDEFNTCNIRDATEKDELIQQTSLIIWDEALMQHRHAFEALDRSLKDIMKKVNSKAKDLPFGDITIVLGGDFRQVFPVIAKGRHEDIVNPSISRSRLWQLCNVFVLQKNMRLQRGNDEEHNIMIEEFIKWVLSVGDGKLPYIQRDLNADSSDIEIPKYLLIQNQGSTVQHIIESTYPDLMSKYNYVEYLRERAILTPTNDYSINSVILHSLSGDKHTYNNVDSIEEAHVDQDDMEASFPIEFLNTITLPRLPHHQINLKKGVVVMLLRYINQSLGLCNGTRMVVTQCLKWTIEVHIPGGDKADTKHFIPTMVMSLSDSKLPFILKRKQLPITTCFAMTINKSQGQNLKYVGLYLPRSVFCRGQLYVAVSRVTTPGGLKILIDHESEKDSHITKKIVYHEIFTNLSNNR